MESNNRRQFLLGASAVAAGAISIGTTTNVFAADSDVPLLLNPYPKEEYLLVKNTTDSAFNLNGHYVDFEYANDGEDQQYLLPSGHTIPAGGTIIIATGAKTVSDAAIDMDEPSNEMNNDESDVYAILDAKKNVVARSDNDKYRGSFDPSDGTTPEEDSSPEDTTTESEDNDETTTTESSDSEEQTSESDDSTTTDESTTSSDSNDSGGSEQSDETTTTSESDDSTETSDSDTSSSSESDSESASDDC